MLVERLPVCASGCSGGASHLSRCSQDLSGQLRSHCVLYRLDFVLSLASYHCPLGRPFAFVVRHCLLRVSPVSWYVSLGSRACPDLAPPSPTGDGDPDLGNCKLGFRVGGLPVGYFRFLVRASSSPGPRGRVAVGESGIF